VSAGVGLVALLAGAADSTPVVVEVQPTPVVVENRIVAQQAADPLVVATSPTTRPVEAATPAPASTITAEPRPVAETEGS
jgi:hypothetical protein